MAAHNVIAVDVAEMYRLYSEENLSGYDLSQRFGISNQSVYRKLREAGYAIREQKASARRAALQVLPTEKAAKAKPLSPAAAELKALGHEVKHVGADLWSIDGEILNAAQVRGRLAWESRRRAA